MWASGSGNGGAYSGPASYFKALRATTNQTLVTATWTKIQFNYVDFDNNNDYDEVTNYRFVAPAAGLYHFDASIYLETPGTANPIEVMFQINGAGVWGGSQNNQGVATVSHNRISISDDVQLAQDGYVEVWVQHYAGVNKDVRTDSFFSGFRVA